MKPRVFLTGARRGIGRAMAYAFAETGYDVVINDQVEDDAAAETLSGLEQRGAKAKFLKANIGDVAALPALADAAFAAFGGLECLVNNAGMSAHKRGDLLEMALASYDEVMAVNLRGPFFLTQAIAKRMLAAPASAHPRSIISIASVNSVMAAPDRGEYCLSKTGVSMMTKLFALRLVDTDIGVFDIRPGVTRTDMTAPVREKYQALMDQGFVAQNRWGEPEDIARVAVQLASGNFHFSTGSEFYVDGGLHVQRL